MRFLTFERNGTSGLAIEQESRIVGLLSTDRRYPGDLLTLLEQGPDALEQAGRNLAAGNAFARNELRILPPIPKPGKIVCVGLNYRDHSAESGFAQPAYPTLFGRFSSGLLGQGAPIVRPTLSDELDYEGELAAVIGKRTRAVKEADALGSVAGYSIFNDGSIRNYQFKAPQWTPGKNFDSTGPFGPVFVTADELPPGCQGLALETRLNGKVMQRASIDDMVFPVASLVSIISEFMTLEPGDVIVTGTPAGIGYARDPRVFLKPGDVCEVEIEGIGVLSNPVVDAAAAAA